MPDITLLKASAYDALQTQITNGIAAEQVNRALGDGRLSLALRDAGVLPLTNVGGTGDAITADLLPSSTNVGITTLSGVSAVEYVPIATNTNDNPSLMVGGTDYAIRDANGGNWPAGGFMVGRSYILRRRTTTLRVISGDVSSTDLSSRVWHTTERNLSLLTPPSNVDQISVASDAGHVTWRRLVSAPVTVDPTIHAQTADGRFWRLSDSTIDIKASISALSAGRVYSLVMNTLSPSGQTTIPTNTNTLIVRRNNGGQEVKFWRPAAGGEIPSNGVDTATVVKDGTDKWWFLIFDGTTLANAVKFHIVIRNTLAVNEDTIPAAASTVMVRKNNGPDFAIWRPATAPETPSDGVPTLITMQDPGGRWWTKIFDSSSAGWPILSSRADATSRLPTLTLLGCTLALVIEGTQMVLRARNATTDALFETSPRWGVAWASGAGGSGNGAALYLPGRPDYEREHLPDYTDPVMQALPGVAAGFGLSLSYAKTDIDFGANWFLTAQARTSTLQPATVVTIPGYEPTTHVIHPCIMEMYDSFRGYRYVMAITAFPNRIDQLEDPFLYGSNDGLNWTLFPDMPQPLDVTPNEWSYQSDVWMVQDPRTGELYVCYREHFSPDAAAVSDPTRQETRLKFRSTRDGVNWSEPHTFLTMVDHASNVSPVSPSILFDPSTLTWHMWAVQRPNLGHWTAKSIYGPWTYQGAFAISSASATKPNQPHHLEVKCIGDQIIAMVGDRWTGDQYLARLSFEAPRTWTWAPATALLADGGSDAFDNRYKATFLPRIKPDGTMRLGIWWTGGGKETLSVRYAESSQAFPVMGWGRAAPGTALNSVAAVAGGYTAQLLTPMGKPATLVDKTRVRVTFPSANTSGGVTLTINGMAYTVRARLEKLIVAGDLQANTEYEFELRKTNMRAICLDIIK